VEYEALANEVGVRLSTNVFSGSNALKAVVKELEVAPVQT